MPTHQFRRVVTTHNNDGQSEVLIDDLVAEQIGWLADLWMTSETPASLSENTDTLPTKVKLEPPPSGTICRFAMVPPQSKIKDAEASKLFEELGAEACQDDRADYFLMHKTKTLDYVLVIAGEVTLLLDNGELNLKPFDVVVQRGTNHGWVNRGHSNAILFVVLVDAKDI